MLAAKPMAANPSVERTCPGEPGHVRLPQTLNFTKQCHTKMKMYRLIVAVFLLMAAPVFAQPDAPSRPPVKGCKWVKLANASVGLAAWVQQCDFGFRKIDFIFQENMLAIRYSDGGAPEPVVDIVDLLPGEAIDAGLKRFFTSRTEKSLAKRCLLAAYPGAKPPSGASRYTFVPNAAYQKELKAKADPNEVGEPPCGDWGNAPDGIQYFEAWPQSGVRKVLFVREGQDEPLFDEKTLQLIAPR